MQSKCSSSGFLLSGDQIQCVVRSGASRFRNNELQYVSRGPDAAEQSLRGIVGGSLVASTVRSKADNWSGYSSIRPQQIILRSPGCVIVGPHRSSSVAGCRRFQLVFLPPSYLYYQSLQVTWCHENNTIIFIVVYLIKLTNKRVLLSYTFLSYGAI